MHDEFHDEEHDLTLQDLGIEPRLATAAERPSFFTRERLEELLPGLDQEPTIHVDDVGRTRQNARVAFQLQDAAARIFRERNCRYFPDATACMEAHPSSGEARVRRPSAPGPPPAGVFEVSPGRVVPRARAPQEVDAFDSLRSRLAEEALLRQRDQAESEARERGQATEQLARIHREQLQRTAEEAFFALTPLQRRIRGLTLAPGGGVQRAQTFLLPR